MTQTIRLVAITLKSHVIQPWILFSVYKSLALYRLINSIFLLCYFLYMIANKTDLSLSHQAYPNNY